MAHAEQSEVPTAEPTQRDLAHAYIDRRLLEIGIELGEQISGKRALPLGWHNFDTPSSSVREYLVVNTIAKREFLSWVREQVEDGNEAWTKQLAEQERQHRDPDQNLELALSWVDWNIDDAATTLTRLVENPPEPEASIPEWADYGEQILRSAKRVDDFQNVRGGLTEGREGFDKLAKRYAQAERSRRDNETMVL